MPKSERNLVTAACQVRPIMSVRFGTNLVRSRTIFRCSLRMPNQTLPSPLSGEFLRLTIRWPNESRELGSEKTSSDLGSIHLVIVGK
jgi:hypothetical protein